MSEHKDSRSEWLEDLIRKLLLESGTVDPVAWAERILEGYDLSGWGS